MRPRAGAPAARFHERKPPNLSSAAAVVATCAPRAGSRVGKAVPRRSRSDPRPSRLPGYARMWGRGMADAVISAMRVYRERSRAGASDLLRDAHVAVRSWTHERSFTLTVLATLVVCLGGN